MNDQQPSFKYHPNGTASFCFRVKTATGAKWQAWTHKPQPIQELIRQVETEYLPYLRRFAELEKASSSDARFTDSEPGKTLGSAIQSSSSAPEKA